MQKIIHYLMYKLNHLLAIKAYSFGLCGITVSDKHANLESFNSPKHIYKARQHFT